MAEENTSLWSWLKQIPHHLGLYNSLASVAGVSLTVCTVTLAARVHSVLREKERARVSREIRAVRSWPVGDGHAPCDRPFAGGFLNNPTRQPLLTDYFPQEELEKTIVRAIQSAHRSTTRKLVFVVGAPHSGTSVAAELAARRYLDTLAGKEHVDGQPDASQIGVIIDVRRSPFVSPLTLATRLLNVTSSTSDLTKMAFAAASTLLGAIGADTDSIQELTNAGLNTGSVDEDGRCDQAGEMFLSRWKEALAVLRGRAMSKPPGVQLFDNADYYLAGVGRHTDIFGRQLVRIFVEHLSELAHTGWPVVLACTPSLYLSLCTSPFVQQRSITVTIGEVSKDTARDCYKHAHKIAHGSPECKANTGINLDTEFEAAYTQVGGSVVDLCTAATFYTSAEIHNIVAPTVRLVDTLFDPRSAVSGTVSVGPLTPEWTGKQGRSLIPKLLRSKNGRLLYHDAVLSMVGSDTDRGRHDADGAALSDGEDAGGSDSRGEISPHRAIRSLCAHGILAYFPVEPVSERERGLEPKIDYLTFGSPKVRQLCQNRMGHFCKLS